MSLVVGGVAVAEHSHHIRKDDTGSIVLVRVEEDAQTVKLVLVAKDGTLLCSIRRHPHGETITEEVALAVDVEFELNLPVGRGQGDSGVDPSRLRGTVRGETNVLVGADDGVAAKVPPPALQVRVEIGLYQRMRAEGNALHVRGILGIRPSQPGCRSGSEHRQKPHGEWNQARETNGTLGLWRMRIADLF